MDSSKDCINMDSDIEEGDERLSPKYISLKEDLSCLLPNPLNISQKHNNYRDPIVYQYSFEHSLHKSIKIYLRVSILSYFFWIIGGIVCLATTNREVLARVCEYNQLWDLLSCLVFYNIIQFGFICHKYFTQYSSISTEGSLGMLFMNGNKYISIIMYFIRLMLFIWSCEALLTSCNMKALSGVTIYVLILTTTISSFISYSMLCIMLCFGNMHL